MECPRRWAMLIIFIYFLLPDVNILCQNVPSELAALRTTQVKDVPNVVPTPSKAQFMNTLLAFPTSYGVEPTIQSSLTLEKPCSSPVALDERPKTVNLISLQPQASSYYPKESIAYTGQPVVSNTPSSNIILSSPISSAHYGIQPQQQSIIEPIPYGIPKMSKAIENYASFQPTPVCQNPQQQANELYSYRNVSPVTLADANLPTKNLQISPPTSILPQIYTDTDLDDALNGSNLGTQESKIFGSDDDGVPLNLQINLPPQNVPAPRIILVSAVQPPAATENTQKENSLFPTYGFPPFPPPVIMRRPRKSWKNILPIILIALFNDQDNSGGGCCCSNCDSNDPIPIPYPIPIPVNNPVINNRSLHSSRKKDDEENEDYKKRK